MRMRVEELALQADVSVDTIRYYQKQGLLPAPGRDGRLAWYSSDHLERIARIKELQRRGFTLAVIRRFLSGEVFALARRFHAMSREVASEAVELFDTYVRKPLRETDLEEAEKAERMVEAFGRLMPAVGTLVANHFRQILLQVAKEHFEA
jgi:DNA-binding transcriptional MerR regulator